jgi:hypothetical protein
MFSSAYCWLRTQLKALLYDHKNTLSLGRLLIIVSFLTMLVSVLGFSVLVTFIVLTGQMGEGAPLIASLSGIFIALFGSGAVAQIGLYFIQQRSGGGASAAQLESPGPQAPCDPADPGGI